MSKKSRKNQYRPSKPGQWDPVDPKLFAEAFEPVLMFLDKMSLTEMPPTKKELEVHKARVVAGVGKLLRDVFPKDEPIVSALYRAMALGNLLSQGKLGERQTRTTVEKGIVFAAALVPLRPSLAGEPIANMIDVEELKATADRYEVQEVFGGGLKKVARRR